jgi:CheY-like chemotaxis protein
MKLRSSGTASLLARTFGLRAPIGALALFGSFAAYDAPLAGSTAAALLLLARGLRAAALSRDAQHALELRVEQLETLLRTEQQNHATREAGFAQAQQKAVATLDEAIGVLHSAQRRIVSCARALSDALDPETSSLHPLRSAAETLAHIAHDALDHIPPADRAIVFDENSVDLRELIDGVALLVAPIAARQQARLQICIDRSVAALVLADRARLGQTLFNLLVHATEVSGQGVVTLSARAESLNAGAQRIVIGINGTATAAGTIGEHPDLTLARVIARKMGGDITILEGKRVGVCIALHAPFTIERHEWPVHGNERRWACVDVDNYTDRQAICEALRKLGITTLPSDAKPPVHIDYRFVERGQMPSAHGEKHLIVVTRDALPGGIRERDGSIELSLNPLSWTALRQLCDARGDMADISAERPVPLQPAQFRPASQRQSVLVVDDNDVNRKVLARQLDVLGYRCVSASSGEEALDVLGRESIDLLITDLQMPGMNGVDLARQVRAAADGSSHAVPVILLSANHDTKMSERDRALFGVILVKTSGLNALDDALKRLLPSPTRLEKYDFTALDSLAEQGVDIDALLRDWQQSMSDDLADLARRRASHDEPGMRRALHKLAGAVGIVGNHGLMNALQRASAARGPIDHALLDGLVTRISAQMNDLDGRGSQRQSGT